MCGNCINFGRRNKCAKTGVLDDKHAGRIGVRPYSVSFLLFALLFAAALSRQRFFYALFLAGLKVEGVTFHFLDDVLLLHLTLEATQSVFERLAFLQSYFCQLNYTPKLVLVELVLYCNLAA